MTRFSLFCVVSLFIVSCKSDYDCICMEDGQEVAKQSYENVTRSKAVSNCKAFGTAVKLTNPNAICVTPY